MEINGKPIQEVSFNEVVDFAAGEALKKLVRGQEWRSIIFGVCEVVALWRFHQPN